MFSLIKAFGFFAAVAATTTLVAATPVAIDTNAALAISSHDVNSAAHVSAQGIVTILTELKVNLVDACAPFGEPPSFAVHHAAHTNAIADLPEASITADVVVNVQAKALAAIQVAIDACGKIQAEAAVALCLAECLAIAVQLAACIQIVVAAFAKVTCGCVAAELAVCVKEVECVSS
jgi:hypothetical protein